MEAYVGEYASGKSECAVNRALELLWKALAIIILYTVYYIGFKLN
ncbi:hypothetical protein UF75_2419 [Desulfosporosinus sp. I2]|nr:hypothetical protein UF75_2419 [Desulfosporosinus sp. I2]